jgi:hypothetical protein
LRAFPRRAALAGLADLGQALPAQADVVGISRGGEARAYPMAALETAGMINDRLGGAALAVWTERSTGRVGAFEREIGGEEVRLALRDGMLQIEGGAARWELSGEPLDGGEPLQRVAALRVWWQGWKEFHPQSDVYPSGKTG